MATGVTSDGSAMILGDEQSVFAVGARVASLRPKSGRPVRPLSSLEADVTSGFGGTGRPTHAESERRRREFLRLVAGGVTLRDAAKQAGVKPDRALDLVEPLVRPLLAA